MSLGRAIATLALVAAAACASHAQLLTKHATMGVKAQLAQIDSAIARTLGDQHARGAVTGALAELGTEQHRELLSTIVDTTSRAATRAVMFELAPESERLQQLVDRTVASAIGSVGRGLAQDTTLRDQLAALSHQVSASAVYGARDALSDIFPECRDAVDRRHCVEDEIGSVSRAAARGMMAGVIGAVRWPVLVLVFLAGMLVTLLLVRTRSALANGKAPASKHANERG